MVTKRLVIYFSFVGWFLASVAGMAILWTYEAKPGVAASAPDRWPQDSLLDENDSGPTLLVWLHPRCPCSRATVGELERLLMHLPDNVSCRVVLTQPTEADAAFTETALTQCVRRLDRVSLVVDTGQHEAKRFGVSTSGQVLLYEQGVGLVFSGGITSGRGHEGDNLGAAALREIFREHRATQYDHEKRFRIAKQSGGSRPETSTCCVYGCELMDPNDLTVPSDVVHSRDRGSNP